MAQIGAAHGLKGDVRLRSFTQDPEGFAHYGPLQTEDGTRLLEIESARSSRQDFIVRFRGVSDRCAAEALRNERLFVPRERLPQAADDEFYYADLIGLCAQTPAGEPLGEVISMHNFGAGDILELRLTKNGESLMLPFDEKTVPQVDVAGGRIVVQLPEDVEVRDTASLQGDDKTGP